MSIPAACSTHEDARSASAKRAAFTRALAFVTLLLTLWCVSLGFASAEAAAASSPHRITLGAEASSSHFIVESQSQEAADQALGFAEQAWNELSERFTLAPDGLVEIVVVEDEEEYDRIQPASMTRGFATFGGNTMYLRGAQSDAEVITHELTHIWLGKIARPGLQIPDWFNEGLAQHAAGTREPTLELIYRMNAGEILSLPALGQIDALQSSNRELATLQGLAVVRFLVSEFGEEKLWELVDGLRYARTFNQALMEAYDLTDLELSAKWMAYAETNYSVLSPLVLRTAGLLLTGLLAVLAALVWWGRRARNARQEGEPGLSRDELAAVGWGVPDTPASSESEEERFQ